MENDMSKKNQTKKVKEKKIPERELIGGKYYLIDAEKWAIEVYGSRVNYDFY